MAVDYQNDWAAIMSAMFSTHNPLRTFGKTKDVYRAVIGSKEMRLQL